MFQWMQQHEALAWWLAAASAAMFVGTLIATPIIIAKLPADYFVRAEEDRWSTRHPALRIGWLIVKNLLGVVLLVAGIAMLVLPGQGLLTIVVGLLLLSFPGKHRFTRWLIGRAPVHRAMNWMRRKRGAEPLQLP